LTSLEEKTLFSILCKKPKWLALYIRPKWMWSGEMNKFAETPEQFKRFVGKRPKKIEAFTGL